MWARGSRRVHALPGPLPSEAPPRRPWPRRGEELKAQPLPSPWDHLLLWSPGPQREGQGQGQGRAVAGVWGPPTALGAVAGLTAWRHPALGLRHLKDFSAIYCSYC